MTERSFNFADSVLLINKPSGITSFNVIGKIRRLLGEKRVGHSGTLDKFATGLLVICVGRATRISQYFLDGDKKYKALVRFGIATDTCDTEGVETFKGDVSDITEDKIRQILPRFTGSIMQRPPEYSAIKIEGTRASDRVRRGETVEMADRPVTIYSIELTGFSQKDSTFEITVFCSKGTYIRSLARDMGEALGCGAHLSALERTASSDFSLDNALTLEELEDVCNGGSTQKHWNIRISEALSKMGICRIDDDGARKVLNGAQFARQSVSEMKKGSDSLYLILNQEKNCIAIAGIDIDNWSISYKNVFN